MKKISTLRWVFLSEIALFALIVVGVVPRGFAWVLAALIIWYSLRATLQDAVILFVMSIPLFIALPITSAFDNFNTWRIISLVIAGRALWNRGTRATLWNWVKTDNTARWLGILLLLAVLSLIGSQYPLTGIKRIIYFVNLSLVPIVLGAMVRQGKLATERVIKALIAPTAIVVIVGFVQLVSTYVMDVYQFMRVWGEGIQLHQFGTEWSLIATHVGNTWLAYYGDQLSLRVFSLFPDSHSFPTFVLLGIPAILAFAWQRARRFAAWIAFVFLMVILSGTRGIWAASLGVVSLVFILLFAMRKLHVAEMRYYAFKHSAKYLILFFLMFLIAWPLFISPQFLLSKGDFGMFAGRLRSIIDFGETSNAQRIAIWNKSIESIARHPLLGVGIGNFPVVLNQDILFARAGSTAHNLYLHVGAEMGLPAMLIVIGLLVHVWLVAWRWFVSAQGPSLTYAAALLLYLPWVYAYVLTDPIIFDERVFLMFATTLALVWSHDHA